MTTCAHFTHAGEDMRECAKYQPGGDCTKTRDQQ